jgi:hypothetical protein
MRPRVLASGAGLAVVVAAVSLAVVPIEAQSRTTPVNPKTSKEWIPSHTPWGDPDISGDFSNKYEIGTPFERPKEFDGKRVEDFTPQELAELAKERQERNLLNYPHNGGEADPGGGLGGPNYWGDRFEISKGSRPWFVVDPPDGKLPPLTEEAQQRQRARGAARRQAEERPASNWDEWRDHQNMSLYDRCITRGLPNSMMPASYGNSYRILQTPDYVAIQYEMVHETRVIPLDKSAHLPSVIRQYMGDGRGHWEGNTLVVETTNFKPESVYRGANPDRLRMIERFTPVAHNVVEWKVTMEDPTTWVRPWTQAMPLTKNDREAIVEYACHEGNISMPLRLGAGRAEELEREEAAKKGVKLPPRERFADEFGGQR